MRWSKAAIQRLPKWRSLVTTGGHRVEFSNAVGPTRTPLTDYLAPDLQPVGDTRMASVAVIGAPNAGKSSLMNCIIRNRVAAVSRKVNTTRSRVVGAYTDGLRQLIFWDTPGVVERQFVKSLGSERRELTTAGWGAAADADIVLMVVDTSRGLQYWKKCAKISEQLGAIRLKVQASQRELSESVARDDGADGDAKGDVGLVLVLNKCDITRPRTRILEAAEFFRDNVQQFASTFVPKVYMISAYNGRGVQDLREDLLQMTRPGDFEVPEGVSHCDDDLALIREHIWEKLLHRVHQEVPYRCRFENDRFAQLPNGDLYVSEIIRVPRSTNISIVIGPNGSTIEWIRETAMQSASAVLGRPIHLKLRVAVA